MARGWESKSVEAQQAEASETSTPARSRLTPEAARRQRDRESLRLARNRVLQQLDASRNPRHRQMLQASLAELEERMKALE